MPPSPSPSPPPSPPPAPPGASYQPATTGAITLNVANAAAITAAQRTAIRTGIMSMLTGCIGVEITGITTGSAIVSYNALFSTDAQADTVIAATGTGCSGTGCMDLSSSAVVMNYINSDANNGGQGSVFNSVSALPPLHSRLPVRGPFKAHSLPRLSRDRLH